ncbi:MAG: MMPL family transporter, partial [Sandaracinaceae bacterium]|nr:MMPL family transporter [Sandaracinaceae bacterium]
PEDAIDPLEPLLGRVIATDPERFPAGLLSLGARHGQRRLRVAALVEGERVEEDERRAIVELARSSPSLRGRVVDASERVAVIAITPRAGISPLAVEEQVHRARGWLASVSLPEGARVELAGMPAIRASMVEALRADQLVLVLLAVLGSVLVLAIGLRSWPGVLLPLGAAGITSAIVIGTMAAVGEPINLLNNTIAPLLITIGLGDAVHLFARYREELARDGDRFAAARRTMRTMARACLLTSATTAIGFGSLLVSDTSIVRHYAITAALGVMLGYLITLVFMPAALPDFPVGSRASTRRSARAGGLERATTRIASIVARRSRLLVVAALAALAITSWIGARVRIDSALKDQLDPSSPSRSTLERMERRLGGVRRLEIGLLATDGRFDDGARLRDLGDMQDWLRAQPQVLRVEGPSDLAVEAWAQLAGPEALSEREALSDPERASALVALATQASPELARRWLRDEGRRARIEVRVEDAGERATLALLARIEARLARMPDVHAAVGGEAALSARGLDRLIADLSGGAGLAMLVIFALIGGLLRSVRLGLISILPNVMPIAITVAYMVVRDIPLHAATTIVFSVAIGLAVDDTIHILARYREEIAAGRSRVSSTIRSLRSSGRAAVVSGMTIWIGYAALLFASFVPVRLFGELSLVALGSALVCEILVLPALLVLFGPGPDARRSPVRARTREVAAKAA